jgi:hypothetical protein
MQIVPFVGIQPGFRGVAPGARNERERKLICSAHRSEKRLVILRAPHLPNSFRRHISNPLPDRDRSAGDFARQFVHDFLPDRQSTLYAYL